MTIFDMSIAQYMAQNMEEWPCLTNVALFFDMAGSTELLLAVGLVISIILAVQKKWHKGSVMFLSVVIASGAVLVIKHAVQRIRPDFTIIEATGYSFPSGHATLSAAFFIALAYILLPHINNKTQRMLAGIVLVILPIAIGFSRVVLGVHWFSDVIAGWSIGILSACIAIYLVKKKGGVS